MTSTQRSTRRWLGCVTLVAVAVLFAAWSGFGLWFQLATGPLVRVLIIGVWVAGLAATFVWTFRSFAGGLLLILLSIGYLTWWFSIEPRLYRDWAPEVRRTVTGRVDGDAVTLLNVRNFSWLTEREAEERWEWRRYDLSELVEADLVLSYWGIDAIAHTLVSFGFSDGRRIVFSVEIRRERTEKFSSVAGFFRTYELALIASEESDILRLRTNMRGEDTYLYPLALSPSTLRALFLSYVETGNELAREPSFYNTLTANCTTVIFDLARAIEPGIPMDLRILLSGYLPSYLVEHGALRWGDVSEAEARERAAISAKARQNPSEAGYSSVVRSGS